MGNPPIDAVVEAISQERLEERMKLSSLFGSREYYESEGLSAESITENFKLAGGITRIGFDAAQMAFARHLEQLSRTQGNPPIDTKAFIDHTGSLRARIHGSTPGKIIIASHLDSVFNGGIWDGASGVLAGLEVLAAMRDTGYLPHHTIEVLGFSCEESSEYHHGCITSSFLLGDVDMQTFLDLHGKETTIRERMQANLPAFHAGVNHSVLRTALLNQHEIKAYFEIHPEQGRILYEQNLQIGIVTAIAAPERYNVFVKGRPDHSGTTPYDLRRDAVKLGVEFLYGIYGIFSLAYAEGRNTVITPGYVVSDGSMNTISGSFDFTLDIRDTSREDRVSAFRKIDELRRYLLGKEEYKDGYEIKLKPVERKNPVTLDEGLAAHVKECAEQSPELDGKYRLMHSGAGHDAMVFQKNGIPSAMIFFPSIEGKSHRPDEESRMPDYLAAVRLLTRSVLDYDAKIL